MSGRFFIAGSRFVTFDRETLPISKASFWFIAPAREDDKFACGSDDTSFYLDSLDGMKESAAIKEQGHNYYFGNRVKYICLDDNKGYAVVEGNEYYLNTAIV